MTTTDERFERPECRSIEDLRAYLDRQEGLFREGQQAYVQNGHYDKCARIQGLIDCVITIRNWLNGAGG